MKMKLSSIFYMLFLFIFPALSFIEAQNSPVKPWPAPGVNSFMRLDGGQIEVEKGLLTDWTFLKDKNDQEVAAHLYTKYRTRSLELINELGVDWIWVTWSNGFSLFHETQQREDLTQLIAAAHQRNIKVSAYLSLTNIFWEEMFRREPDSRNWIRKDSAGNPLLYGGKHVGRYIGDLKNSQWRDYVKNKVKLALLANVDAIYFDNISAEDSTDVVSFIKETRDLILTIRKQEIPVYLNRLTEDITKHSNVILGERTEEPGIIHGKRKDNIQIIKKFLSRAGNVKAIKYEHARNFAGERLDSMMTEKGYVLSLAEAAAFHSTFYISPEGVTLRRMILPNEQERKVIQRIGQYHKFFKDHQQLYQNGKVLYNSVDTPKNITLEPNTTSSNLVATISKDEALPCHYLHLINYSNNELKDISVNVLGVAHPPSNARLFSPDTIDSSVLPIQTYGQRLKIGVPKLNNYAVLALCE